MINWHRLFGLGLTDYFTDSGYEVKVEKDLSIKQQFLDVLIIEQESGSQISEPPDGLENLAQHNLMTYKSLQQPLDAWTLDELIGHYVNYRKQSSPSFKELLPVEYFRLYAVSTRHPDNLETQATLTLVKKGVYDLHWGSRQVRLIVLSEIPKIERNALWLLFSDLRENVQYGALHYRWRRTDLSTAINDLFEHYQIEGITMSYTVEDYKSEVKEKTLASLPPEERQRLEGLPLTRILDKVWLKKLFHGELSVGELFAIRARGDWVKNLAMEDIFEALPLEKVPSEELLKKLPPEERLKGLPPEERLKGLPAEEFLKRLTREEIEAYLKKLSASN